jgi:DNA helicase-2/ATP-dependent DNA helicase PcrA
MFYADLHVHSKYSLATSRDCDLERLALWAGRKGIAVLGSGDFTHPAWFAEIHKKLAPAAPGLFRLKETGGKRLETSGAGGRFSSIITHHSSLIRFMLQVEISTVYKKNDRVRKVHHVVYVPDFASARRLIKKLERLGSLGSDGRPTLKLDSRDLLEIVLNSGEGCHLVPAHIWTPWFGVLGSKSGFDSIEECYGDLSAEIFAVETGLSADPATNWLVSALDRYASVSNSDAHSPAKLGREATVFNSKIDYFSMFHAIKTGTGFLGTVEFFPEEGRYHHDGHRKCGVCITPEESRKHKNKCPVCGKPLTLGVMHRVSELADRSEPSPHPNPLRAPTEGWSGEGTKLGAAGVSPVLSKETTGKMPVPPGPRLAPFSSLIPLVEVLSEIHKVGPQSKCVKQKYDELLAILGPELFILANAPLEEISRKGSSLLSEAISRMRAGRVIRRPGFDGQYGSIRLFTDAELK